MIRYFHVLSFTTLYTTYPERHMVPVVVVVVAAILGLTVDDLDYSSYYYNLHSPL